MTCPCCKKPVPENEWWAYRAREDCFVASLKVRRSAGGRAAYRGAARQLEAPRIAWKRGQDAAQGYEG